MIFAIHDVNQPWIYMCSPSRSPLPPPPFFLRIVWGLGGKREKQKSHTLPPCVSLCIFFCLIRTLSLDFGFTLSSSWLLPYLHLQRSYFQIRWHSEFGVTWIFGRHYSPTALLCWLSRWRISLKCRKPRFIPWVRKIPRRRQLLPTPVFLPGDFHGQKNLAGYSSWGGKVRHDWTHSFSFHTLTTHIVLHMIYSYFIWHWTEQNLRDHIDNLWL